MANVDTEVLRSLQRSINDDIDAYIAATEQGNSKDEERIQHTRGSIYAAAYKLSQLTVDPFQEVLRLGLQPTINMAVRIAIDLDLFNLVKESKTLDSLVQRTGAERSLLLRIIRTLAAVHMIDELDVHTYASTPISNALTVPAPRDWIKTCYDFVAPTWLEVPSFIAANSSRDITDLDHNPTRKVWGANFFDALAQHPQLETDFASAMSISDVQPPSNTPHYPFADAIDEFKPYQQDEPSPHDAVFMVDVGGGSGHYINQILKIHPEIPGRIIIQDLESVVARTDPNPRFESAVHDFFTPQPVKHAKFYHLRHILHDWPDSACVKILEQLRPAFKPGFSRLLLNGNILAASGVGTVEAMADLIMLTLCGMERDETQWHNLLGKAGFKILRIFRAKRGALAIIEAGLADEVVADVEREKESNQAN